MAHICGLARTAMGIPDDSVPEPDPRTVTCALDLLVMEVEAGGAVCVTPPGAALEVRAGAGAGAGSV